MHQDRSDLYVYKCLFFNSINAAPGANARPDNGRNAIEASSDGSAYNHWQRPRFIFFQIKNPNQYRECAVLVECPTICSTTIGSKTYTKGTIGCAPISESHTTKRFHRNEIVFGIGLPADSGRVASNHRQNACVDSAQLRYIDQDLADTVRLCGHTAPTQNTF